MPRLWSLVRNLWPVLLAVLYGTSQSGGLQLVDLTELAYAGKWKGMVPSAGGCDEFIRLYMFRREVERDVLTEL